MRSEKIAVFFLCCITLLLQTQNSLCDCKAQTISKTSLANTQAPFSSVSPEMVSGFRPDRTYAREDGKQGTVQVVPFGGRSTNAANLARYFFPKNQTVLVVAEDDLADNFDKKKDLLAQHFNIFTNDGNFRSEISIAPRQSVAGCGFYWRQRVWRHEWVGKGFWVSASAPIVHVKTKMNLTENVTNDGGGPNPAADVVVMPNMTQALQQDGWNFGKITQDSHSITRLGDIEFKFGYDDWLPEKSSHLELYIGVIIPTSNGMKSKFVFEPIVGRGKHAGLMLGCGFGKRLWLSDAEDMNVKLELASHSEYLFSSHQMRSFDLVDKPWSRYIEMYSGVAQAQQAAAINPPTAIANNLATPGINILTQKVTVTPGFSYDLNGALVGTFKRFQAEAGYNLFLRRQECVKLTNPWQEGAAIKYTEGLGQTNPIRDITGNKYYEQFVRNNSGVPLIPVALADYAQSLLMQDDIDLQSASTPSVVSQTVYGTVGYNYDIKEFPVFGHFGVSYTFSQNNAVISKWMLWIKGGISF